MRSFFKTYTFVLLLTLSLTNLTQANDDTQLILGTETNHLGIFNAAIEVDDLATFTEDNHAEGFVFAGVIHGFRRENVDLGNFTPEVFACDKFITQQRRALREAKEWLKILLPYPAGYTGEGRLSQATIDYVTSDKVVFVTAFRASCAQAGFQRFQLASQEELEASSRQVALSTFEDDILDFPGLQRLVFRVIDLNAANRIEHDQPIYIEVRPIFAEDTDKNRLTLFSLEAQLVYQYLLELAHRVEEIRSS